MKRWYPAAFAALSFLAFPCLLRAAEVTDVIDAVDDDDPIDINIDVGFHSTLSRSKITHEWSSAWTAGYRPDFNELRFEQQTYTMDYTVEIGLYHDLELYVNLPWIISDHKQIGYVSGVSNSSSTLFQASPGPDYPGNAVAQDPTASPSSKRSGIGDMQVGLKWAIFNDERDDTKSVWILGLDYRIPSGNLNKPQEVASGGTGGVGMGQHVLTPFMLFSHRFSILDPYVGIHGSIPIQGKDAKNAGLVEPYHGGFLAGMEIVPWEVKDKFQKFAIDVRLTTDYFGEVDSKGDSNQRGTVNEMSDFLSSIGSISNPYTNPALYRQLQSQSNYTRFGLHLGFVVRAAEYVRFRFGVSLEHQTEHFLTGADYCKDMTGDGDCGQAGDIDNDFFSTVYDEPGQRLRIEETTIFTYWLTGMITF